MAVALFLTIRTRYPSNLIKKTPISANRYKATVPVVIYVAMPRTAPVRVTGAGPRPIVIDFVALPEPQPYFVGPEAYGNSVTSSSPRRASLRRSAIKSPRPNRSSSSRTRMRPPSEVTRDPWEIQLQRGVERKLKRLILFLTHWVLTSSASSSRWNPHE